MRNFIRILSLAGLLSLVGCSSLSNKTILTLPDSLPRSFTVMEVPFISQNKNHCGPASLAMVMEWSQQSLSFERLTESLITPEKKGTFPIDMISAARREGLLAIPVRNLSALLEEIAAGHPVIVFQNLGFSWYPFWHFSVAFGYDLNQGTILMHSGQTSNLSVNLNSFEKSWELGEKWALVVLPPNQFSKTVSEIEHLEAAVALERIGHNQAAEAAYLTILQKWPKSLGAWFGLGNVYYTKKDLNKSSAALQQAIHHHPRAVSAWHNLAWVYFEQGKYQRAYQSANRALQFASQEERSTFRKSLENVLTSDRR